MAGGIRTKDVRTSWDDVGEATGVELGEVLNLIPEEKSLIPEREKIK